MTTKPFYNAGLAFLYIILVVGLINAGSYFAGPDKEDNIFMPIGMLSLFTLSAAIMAYLFFYQPVILFLEGKRKEGVMLFARTLGVFAVITVAALIVSFILVK